MIAEVIQELRTLTPEQLRKLSSDDLAEAEILVEAHGKEKVNSLLRSETASFESGPLRWLTEYTRTENPNYHQQRREYKAPLPRNAYSAPFFHPFLSAENILTPTPRYTLTT